MEVTLRVEKNDNFINFQTFFNLIDKKVMKKMLVNQQKICLIKLCLTRRFF